MRLDVKYAARRAESTASIMRQVISANPSSAGRVRIEALVSITPLTTGKVYYVEKTYW
jgi:hypothetical protein